MNYVVTGATGFIGKFLIEQLLQDEGVTVHALVREGSETKFEALESRFSSLPGTLVRLPGDVTQADLVSAAQLKKLVGKVQHVFHLAAVYDMDMSDDTANRINIEGTRNVLAFVKALGGEVRLHHVSSIAVAGAGFSGRFTEKMFDEGQEVDHPYFRSKFESEAIVRNECAVPYRIYRPGVVVGHSETGEMDKIDGPYYFFKSVQKISFGLPKWIPLIGIKGGRVPIVPVDYVARALKVIGLAKSGDGQCFHLVQADAPSVGDLLQTLLKVAHGPELATKLDLSPGLLKLADTATRRLPRNLEKRLSEALGAPLSTLSYLRNEAVFDDQQTRKALRGSGVRCPDFRDYAPVLWAFWEQHLDLDISLPKGALRALAGKVVVVTGASSGIGLNVAKKLGAAGARVVLVARTREKLEQTQCIIEKAGGEAHVYPCDLNDMNAIDRCAQQILDDLGHVDVLVNNAGRSIRRAVLESTTRFHDFERTMQLNYFGAIRMILAFLPSMVQRNSGHVINISSIGVLANAARFSAYVASKAALDAFSRSLAAEVMHRNIEITAIYMPLVRTPMIAPTKIYDYAPAWSPDHAADVVVKAIVHRPKSVATPLGTAAAISYAVWPKVNDYILNKGFNLFPSSASAKGKKSGGESDKPSLQQVVFANLFKGEYF